MREMLPAYNLIKTVLLSCRLQRIPQKLQIFLCPYNIYQSKKALPHCISYIHNKGHENPAVKTCTYKNQWQSSDCSQGSQDFTQLHPHAKAAVEEQVANSANELDFHSCPQTLVIKSSPPLKQA